MVLNKVVVGFVVQQYDTEAKRFLNQEFKSSDEVQWEDLDCAPVEPPVGEDGQEPYLNMEMVQPPAETPTPIVPPSGPPLVASPFSFYVGETVEVIPSGEPGDLIQHEFIGTVVGVRNGTHVIVKDQEDDHFDCDPAQVHHLTAYQ